MNGDSVDENFPSLDRFQTVDAPNQRRLAATTWAGDDDNSPSSDLEGDIVEDVEPPEPFVNTADTDKHAKPAFAS